MKKILLFCIPAILFVTSCADDIENIDPKAAITVPGPSLVSNAQRSLTNILTSTNVNNNPFRLYVQYWAETTYPDESQYIIETRTINRGFWDPLYRDVLSDLNEAKKVVTADPMLTTEPTEREQIRINQLAAIEVLEVYTWSVLVNTFGDIPYEQALDIENVLPAYGDDAAIYADLINRLNTAIGQFDPEFSGLGTADLYYGGDIPAWVKFANSLKLRLALTIADVDPAQAKTLAEAAVQGGVFTSNADNAYLNYLPANPNTNPLYVDLVQSGRADFVGANTFVDQLIALNDPRLNEYFKPVGGTGTTFKGGTYGAANSARSNSRPGAMLENPEHPGVLLSYSEVEFLLAEAVERGFAVGGTAIEHYNAGVTASILEWGGTETEAAAYLLQPSVNYLTASGTFKQKIGAQKWIALYNQPVEAWKEWRRLDAPNLVKPAAAISEIPLRLPYPTTEANLNNANYAAASAAMGGDVVTSKVFWDKL